jgi:RNA polymerase sigma-70 factor (ECF subfamily)
MAGHTLFGWPKPFDLQPFSVFAIVLIHRRKDEYSSLNEEKLLEDIRSDPQRFSEVYEAFYKPIFGYVFRRTTNYDAAKDIAAETFLRAYAGIGKFRWRDISILHWLYRIATNETFKYLNSRKYQPESINRIREEYGFDITDYSNAETERILVEEELQRHQDFVKINDLIKKLDMKYQEVLALRFYEQRSIEEIAAILGKKTGTVKSLLSRGVAKLKEEFGGSTNED